MRIRRPPVQTTHGRWLPLRSRPGGREDEKGVIMPPFDAITANAEGDSSARFELKIIADSSTLTTGDGQLIFAVPSDMNGMNLVDADAFVTTVSSSGTPTVQIRNVTDAVDMLTTKITIDANEYTSYTAATAPVIDVAHDDVATGDLIAIDVDVAGTGAKGLGVMLVFR